MFYFCEFFDVAKLTIIHKNILKILVINDINLFNFQNTLDLNIQTTYERDSAQKKKKLMTITCQSRC
jgi:hypothetical protein